jgi:hypothetical protein
MEWVVQEVGEAAFMEFIEPAIAVAAATTGVGQRHRKGVMPRWPIHLSVGLPCPAIVYAHYVVPTPLMRDLAEAKLIRQTPPTGSLLRRDIGAKTAPNELAESP